MKKIRKECPLKMKSMEANKTGSNYLAMKKEAYFRKGLIGDWSNHLTPESNFVFLLWQM